MPQPEKFSQDTAVKLTVIGCSPAWPNAGRRAVRLSRRGRGAPPARLRARRARAAARARRRLAARRRRRDHALPPRPLGRPRAVDLRRELRAGPRHPEAGALAAARRAASGCAPYGSQMSFDGADRRRLRRARVRGRRRRSAAAGFDVVAAAARPLLGADVRAARVEPHAARSRTRATRARARSSRSSRATPTSSSARRRCASRSRPSAAT